MATRLNVNDAARAAGISRYHFCRMFRSATGESVMGYVRARRLTLAAQRLLDDPNARLIDIALDSGFESQQSFTRAFTRQFKIAPGAFRARPLTDPSRFRLRISTSALTRTKEEKAMTPTFIDLPETHVVGFRVSVHLGNKAAIPDAWKNLHSRQSEIDQKPGGPSLGVMLHKPGGPARGFDYLAGVTVEKSPADLPDDMTNVTLGAQQYAVFTHKISDKNLGKDLPRTFDFIFGTWLPNSEYQLAPAPDFELYDPARFNPKTLSGEIDIYVPVQAKGAD